MQNAQVCVCVYVCDTVYVCVCPYESHIFTHTAADEMTDEQKDR